MSFTLKSGAGSDLANVNTNKELAVALNQDPTKAGIAINFSENDDGAKTGTRFALSPETDEDYRLRVATDNPLDSETFNYTAQNTGKHNYLNTTMAAAWSAAGFQTNSGNVTTTATGLRFRTYAYFPMMGPGVLCAEIEASFSEQPTANSIIDFGFFIDAGSNPYAPSDGAYFRHDAAGLKGVVNSNGTEVEVVLPGFTYLNRRVYQFLIVVHERSTQFWIDNTLYAKIDTPIGQGQPFMSGALPFAIRHAHVGGAAGAEINLLVKDYNVSLFGVAAADNLGTIGNRIFGSYQGLSGGTMGSLASYGNSANPTAAVPTNTTSTVLTALGGQGWETDTLAVNTDGIIMSYQVPAGTANALGKRLKIIAIKIDSFVQTALTGGGYNAQFALAFGHTAVSLATGEAASTKAPRRIALGSYSVASGLVALTQLPTIYVDFRDAEIFVNPGEFIQIVKKKIGTAPSAGVIAYTFTPIYSRE